MSIITGYLIKEEIEAIEEIFKIYPLASGTLNFNLFGNLENVNVKINQAVMETIGHVVFKKTDKDIITDTQLMNFIEYKTGNYFDPEYYPHTLPFY